MWARSHDRAAVEPVRWAMGGVAREMNGRISGTSGQPRSRLTPSGVCSRTIVRDTRVGIRSRVASETAIITPNPSGTDHAAG